MKELSIEEKVYDGNYKNYAELINRLEDVKEAIKKQNYGIAMDVLCKPYPEFQVTTHSELKESEDERIRKELLQIANESEDSIYIVMIPDKRKRLIAWLERQGNLMKALQISNAEIGELIEKNYYLKEQLEKQAKNNMGISEATKKKLEDNLNKALEKETPESWNEFLEKQGEQNPAFEMKTPEKSLGIDSDTYNKIVDECVYGEQKPMKSVEEENSSNKVEPKFHKGEWISNGDYTWKIVEVKPLDYILQSQDGNIVDDTISYVDEQFHSFTIEDAKDGDVLIDKSNNRECPFLFKETKPSIIKTDCLNPLTILGYCGIGGAGFTKSEGWGDTANCTYYPATKEQRDTLERAMTNAGYRWDKEKLKLEKI